MRFNRPSQGRPGRGGAEVSGQDVRQIDPDGFVWYRGCRDCENSRECGGSHYHCPKCGGPCNMYGHPRKCPATPPAGAADVGE